MVLVNDPREKFSFRWTTLSALLAGILSFGASSALAHRTLNQYVSATTGMGVVLMALAPPLREISISFQKWTVVIGTIVIGAGFGLLMRLLTR
jgi:drug/metabolite transporter (DMT)-like permease